MGNVHRKRSPTSLVTRKEYVVQLQTRQNKQADPLLRLKSKIEEIFVHAHSQQRHSKTQGGNHARPRTEQPTGALQSTCPANRDVRLLE